MKAWSTSCWRQLPWWITWKYLVKPFTRSHWTVLRKLWHNEKQTLRKFIIKTPQKTASLTYFTIHAWVWLRTTSKENITFSSTCCFLLVSKFHWSRLFLALFFSWMGFVVVFSFPTPRDYKSICLHIFLVNIFFPFHVDHHKMYTLMWPY